MSDRRGRPFGLLEQRELERLRELGANHAHVAALVTLRVRADHNGETRDGMPSLARWACMSESTMKRAIKWLVDQHIVVELARERGAEGPQGAAWRWPRRVSPVEFWPASKEATPEPLPLWRIEKRAPTYEELVAYRAAGGRV